MTTYSVSHCPFKLYFTRESYPWRLCSLLNNRTSWSYFLLQTQVDSETMMFTSQSKERFWTLLEAASKNKCRGVSFLKCFFLQLLLCIPLNPLPQLPPTPIASTSRGCCVEEKGAERVFPDLVLESSGCLFSRSFQVCEVMISLLGCPWRLCGFLEWGPQRCIYSRLCNLTISGLFLVGLLVTPGSLIEKDPRWPHSCLVASAQSWHFPMSLNTQCFPVLRPPFPGPPPPRQGTSPPSTIEAPFPSPPLKGWLSVTAPSVRISSQNISHYTSPCPFRYLNQLSVEQVLFVSS